MTTDTTKAALANSIDVHGSFLRASPVPGEKALGEQMIQAAALLRANAAVVPEGWKLVEKATCYQLICGNTVVANLVGPDAEDNAGKLANLLAAPSAPVLAEPQPAVLWGVPQAMERVSKAMLDDPEYAWAWQCNIAMAAFDEGVPHYTANKAAARFLAMLVPGLDMTKHKGFPTEPEPQQPVQGGGDAWSDDQIDALMPPAQLDAVKRGSISTGGGSYGHEISREPVWTRAEIRQALQALARPPAQPAPQAQGVEDALAIADAIEEKTLLHSDIRNMAARTIRRLVATPPSPVAQPEALPVQYRLLQYGIDTIQAGDEFLQDDSVTWVADPGGIWLGATYNGRPLRPVRRPIEAAHGIASPQDDGGTA